MNTDTDHLRFAARHGAKVMHSEDGHELLCFRPEAFQQLHAEATDLRRDLSIARAELALLRGRPVDVDEFNRATTLRDRLAVALRRVITELADSDEEGLIEHAEEMVVARAVLADFDRDRAASRRAYLADEYRSGLDSPPR